MSILVLRKCFDHSNYNKSQVYYLIPRIALFYLILLRLFDLISSDLILKILNIREKSSLATNVGFNILRLDEGVTSYTLCGMKFSQNNSRR